MDNRNWDKVIGSDTKKFDLKLRDVWNYRDLLFLLVKRDFVAFYKQTILGPVWFLLQPIFTMAVYLFVFGNLAGIPSDGIPRPLFYLAGISAWTYFSECLLKTSTVFKDNADIFGKVYFPRLIMPLSIVMSNLVRFGVTFFLVVLLMAYYLVFTDITFHFNWYILAFPWLIVLMASQGLGLGMIISALTTKYRDLSLLVTFGVQLLMYATTIVYPLSSLKGTMRTIISLNPMTYVIEGIRKGLLGSGTFDVQGLLYSTIISFVLVLLGINIFNRVEKNFIDTI
ncbi:ABC transporter permease [Mucilaginibacter sp. UYCu711]|uniref:ABC transporter permease n=1 Tax=Mucilaginibacter sp. UYCu711 TaxID=3156339 RepID=UPI003D2554C1